MERLTKRERKIGVDEAIEVYADILYEDPSSKIFLPLSLMYREKGMYEEAIRVCREGLEYHPDYSSARAALGIILYENGEEDEARTEFERLLAMAPDHMLARRVLGTICRREGDLAGALTHFRAIADWCPHHEETAVIVKELEMELAAEEGRMEAEPPHEPEDEAPEPVSAGEEVTEAAVSESEERAGVETEEFPSEAEPFPATDEEMAETKLPEVSAGRITEEMLASFYVPSEEEEGADREHGETEATAAPPTAPDEDQEEGPRFDAIEEVAEDLPEVLPDERDLSKHGFMRLSGELTFELADKDTGEEGPSDDDREGDLAAAESVVGDEAGPPDGEDGRQEVLSPSEEGPAGEELRHDEAERVEADEGGIFSSETLARLYFQQGHLDRAARMYEELLRESPQREDVQGRLKQLQELIERGGEGGQAPDITRDLTHMKETPGREMSEERGPLAKDQEVIATLERWLRNLEDMKRAN